MLGGSPSGAGVRFQRDLRIRTVLQIPCIPGIGSSGVVVLSPASLYGARMQPCWASPQQCESINGSDQVHYLAFPLRVYLLIASRKSALPAVGRRQIFSGSSEPASSVKYRNQFSREPRSISMRSLDSSGSTNYGQPALSRLHKKKLPIVLAATRRRQSSVSRNPTIDRLVPCIGRPP